MSFQRLGAAPSAPGQRLAFIYFMYRASDEAFFKVQFETTGLSISKERRSTFPPRGFPEAAILVRHEELERGGQPLGGSLLV